MAPCSRACSGPSRLSRSQGQATATVSGGAAALRRSSCSRCWWRCRMMSGLAQGSSTTRSAGRRTVTLPSAIRPRWHSSSSAMTALSSAGRAVTVPCTAMRSPGSGSSAKRNSCARISQPGPGRRRAVKSSTMPCTSMALAASGIRSRSDPGAPNNAATRSKLRSCRTCSVLAERPMRTSSRARPTSWSVAWMQVFTIAVPLHVTSVAPSWPCRPACACALRRSDPSPARLAEASPCPGASRRRCRGPRHLRGRRGSVVVCCSIGNLPRRSKRYRCQKSRCSAIRPRRGAGSGAIGPVGGKSGKPAFSDSAPTGRRRRGPISCWPWRGRRAPGDAARQCAVHPHGESRQQAPVAAVTYHGRGQGSG